MAMTTHETSNGRPAWLLPAAAGAGAVVLIAAVLALLFWPRQSDAVDSQGDNPPAAPATTTPAPAATTEAPAVDPYEVYLATNPNAELVLSREDAQARAYLGCGQTFAPGTTDAALADAYRPTGICG